MKIKVDQSKLSSKSLQSYDLPQYYVDETIKCEECGDRFKFTAKEQQNLYEVKRKYFWMRPKYCRKHYEEWLQKKNTKNNMDRKLSELEKSDSCSVRFEAAESIYLFNLHHPNHGDVNKAKNLFKTCLSKGYKMKQCEKMLESLSDQGIKWN